MAERLAHPALAEKLDLLVKLLDDFEEDDLAEAALRIAGTWRELTTGAALYISEIRFYPTIQTRLQNALTDLGVEKLQDLSRFTEAVVRSHRLIGKYSMSELRSFMDEYGVSFAEHEPLIVPAGEDRARQEMGAGRVSGVAILAEELGEAVADALAPSSGGAYDPVKELVQVAAVAVSWAQAIQETERAQ